MHSFSAAVTLPLYGLLIGLLTPAQVDQTKDQANTESRRIQNVASEEMWNRVTQCTFPGYPALAVEAHITGTVNIGLSVSPEGDVGRNSRLLDGHPLLAQSAMDALRQWKFRPNVAQGEATWSRVRALVRFNYDGTTAVDLAPAILADNFGDPGTPKSEAVSIPRPRSPAISPRRRARPMAIAPCATSST